MTLRRRLEGVRQGVQRLLTRGDIGEKIDSRLLFRGIGACRDQLAVQIRKLLVIERDGRTTARKPVLLAKLCYSFFRVAKLLAQFDQAVAQPTRGPLGRLKTGVELVDNIGIGHRVGELRGSGRIVPGDGNIEHLGLAAARNRQRAPQAIYRI